MTELSFGRQQTTSNDDNCSSSANLTLKSSAHHITREIKRRDERAIELAMESISSPQHWNLLVSEYRAL